MKNIKQTKYIKKENLQNILDSIFSKDNSKFDISFESNSPEDTIYLGYTLAKYLQVQDILALDGELGSGKTVFMNGIAKYFNIESQVSSPTFSIVNEYSTQNNLNLYHFDVYRLNSIEEFLYDIGQDYFETGICIIEWANIIKEILPENTINIQITKNVNSENNRIFRIWR